MGCHNSLAGLSGPPCTSEGLLESISRLIDPGNWDSAVNEIQKSACYNWYRGLQYDCVFAVTPETDTVCHVLVAYMNSVYEGKIPEYKPGAHPVTGKGTPYWPAYDGAVASSAISRMTGIGLELVQEILYELYWGVQSGRIVDFQIAHPKEYKKNEDILTTPPDNTDIEKNRGPIDFNFNQILTWGLILGVIGVGAYAVTSVVSAGRIFTIAGK